jgi:hypothetical protein
MFIVRQSWYAVGRLVLILILIYSYSMDRTDVELVIISKKKKLCRMCNKEMEMIMLLDISSHIAWSE